MTMLRIAIAALLVVSACNKKEEAKPAPTTETKPAEPTPPPTPTEQPKPTEAAPTEAKPPAATKPAGGFASQADYEKKADELLTGLIAVFKQSGTSCDKLAVGINKFADDHKQEIAGADEFEKANPDADKQLKVKMQPRQQELATALGPAMKKCAGNKAVEDALKRLGD